MKVRPHVESSVYNRVVKSSGNVSFLKSNRFQLSSVRRTGHLSRRSLSCADITLSELFSHVRPFTPIAEPMKAVSFTCSF